MHLYQVIELVGCPLWFHKTQSGEVHNRGISGPHKKDLRPPKIYQK